MIQDTFCRWRFFLRVITKEKKKSCLTAPAEVLPDLMESFFITRLKLLKLSANISHSSQESGSRVSFL